MLTCEVYNISPLLNFNQIATSVALLPGELARRVMRSEDPEERARRAGAYALLERMVRKSTSIFKTTVEGIVKPEFGVLFDSRTALASLRYDSYGKPFFEGYPNAAFNLSHSHRLAACALHISEDGSPASPVGIDAQRIDYQDTDRAERVAARYFSEGEKDLLARSVADTRAYCALFTRIWTRKEAILKYLGVGLTRIADADSTNPLVHGCRFIESQETVSYLNADGKTVEEDYCVTVCCAQDAE